MFDYIAQRKPLVIILAPPCTSFGHWSHINRILHPEAWRNTRQVGEMLATFAARVVRLQLDVDRHLLLEDPAGSAIFDLELFGKLWKSGKVVSINVFQCALGLVVDGTPIYKNTTLWASNRILLKPFIGVRCMHRHHGRLSGTTASGIARSRLAQVWPRPMCQRTCNDIQTLLQECRKGNRIHASEAFICMYPIVGARPRGKPRKSPSGVKGAKRGVIYDCPACIARLHCQHPSDTRKHELPSLCRYYNDETAMWDREACLRTRPGDHPDHHLDSGFWYGPGGLAGERRRRQRDGVPAKAGPCLGLAFLAVGRRDSGPVIDDLGVYFDVGPPLQEEDTLGVLRGLRPDVVTKEERRSEVPIQKLQDSSIDVIDIDDEEGYIDLLSPIIVREQRIAKTRKVLGFEQQHDRADQADQGVAEDHRILDVAKVLRLLQSEDESVSRKVLQRFHVKLYHWQTGRFQSFLRAVGGPSKVCSLVPAVVQA